MESVSASAVFPYLRSCKKECDQVIDGELKGEIPSWLKGCLIRIGSGLLEVGKDRFNHVFDGLALMHRFAFLDGRVTYQSQFLRSDAYRKAMKANRIVQSEFGTRGIPDPCKTIFQRFASFFSLEDTTDNDLINIVLYSDEAYACSETNNIWKIDPDTLESLQKVTLSRFVPVNLAVAHAHNDTDGTVYNVGTSFGIHCSSSFLTPSYCILKFPPKEDKNASPFEHASVISQIPSSRFLKLSYHHSFGMTENYFVFVEQPLYLSMLRLAWSHFVAGTYSDAMHWDANEKTRFHVVRRTDGKLMDTVYVSKGFFVFHHINAYEEDEHLVVDMCCYDEGEVINSLYVKALEELFSNPKLPSYPFVSRGKRYVLPLRKFGDNTDEKQNLISLLNSEAKAYRLSGGSIFLEPETLSGSDPWCPELPRINYDYNGRKYKYYYAIARKDETVDTVHLVKVDTVSRTTVAWSEENVVPSEPVFVAEPNSVNEDSGVILASLLYKDDETKVSMLVLNAKTMKEIGRVTFATNASVPGDFHGTFISKA